MCWCMFVGVECGLFFFFLILLAMGRKNMNMLVGASALMKLTANKYPDKSYVRVFVDSM